MSATGRGAGGGGGGVAVRAGVAAFTGSGAGLRRAIRTSPASSATAARPAGIHHHLLLRVSVSGAAGVLGVVTDVVPSAVGMAVPNPGILAASAAGMVIRPAVCDHWISVPSGPANLLVWMPSAIAVSVLG